MDSINMKAFPRIFGAVAYRIRWMARFLLCRVSNFRGSRKRDRMKIHLRQREEWKRIVGQMQIKGTDANHMEHWEKSSSFALSLVKSSPAACLEIGCESGWFGARLKEHFPKLRYVGLDLLPPPSVHNKMVLADAQNLPFNGRTFDLIVARHVIEHLPNPELFRSELSRTALPGACFLIALPLGYDSDPCHCWHFMTIGGWQNFLRRKIGLEAIESYEFGTIEKELIGLFRLGSQP